jgi:uncharacterized Fe-S cluster-containing radical SAM superfamily enzyme
MQKSNKQQPPADQAELQSRIKKYWRANEDLLERYQLASKPVVYFPAKKNVPFICKIALLLIEHGGGIIDIKFKDLKKY